MSDIDSIDIDGREYAVRIEPDEYMTIMDEQGEGVWCGRLEWAKHDAPRPKGFNGNAEVIEHDYPHKLWWQPEPDVKRSDREQFAAMRQSVLDRVRYGYVVVIVEGPDGESTSLCGVDADDDYADEIAAELAAELHTAWQAEQANRQWAIDHEIVTVGR